MVLVVLVLLTVAPQRSLHESVVCMRVCVCVCVGIVWLANCKRRWRRSERRESWW